MKFELCGKRNAKLVNVDVQAMKVGQKDLRPALLLRWRVTQANDILNLFTPTLRPFLFEPTSTLPSQPLLDGVAPVSDLPQLTEAAKKLGTLSWEHEQGGSSLVIYNGATGHGDIKLAGGTVKRFVIEPHEGGTVDLTFDFYVADLDAETMGDIAVLHQHERDIEVIAPDVMQQAQIPDGEEDDGAGYTPEEALADSMAEKGTAAEGRAAKRLKAAKKARTPLAKKIGRSARKSKTH